MRSAKISELKAGLSSYLAGVRRGETVVVYDRSTPIARLVPYQDDLDGLRIDQPSRPRAELKKLAPIRMRKRVDVVAMLRASRDER